MPKTGNIVINRGGGGGFKARVNPPSILLSQNFTPKENPGFPMSIAELASRARHSGFIDGDDAIAHFLLGRTSYQHISDYFPLFENPLCNLPKTMKSVHALMTLDRKFQMTVLEYIGLVEMQLRARYSYEMSTRYGAFAHRIPKLYKNQAYFDDFLRRYGEVMHNASRRNGTRAQRDIRIYGDMPIWEAVEEMSLGMLSKLYSNTRNPKIRNAVAQSFECESDVLANWIRSLSVVRNRCAHFGKLLGERLAIMPKRIPGIDADNGNPFYIVLVLMRLLRANVDFRDIDLLYSPVLAMDMIQLFEKHSELLPALEIPENWRDLICSDRICKMQPHIGGKQTEKQHYGTS